MLGPRLVRRVVPVAVDLSKDFDPIVGRVLAARGIQTASSLDTALTGLARPEQLSGMAIAVELLAEACVAQRRICIVGDYDADGATSCALALRALAMLGAGPVDFVVPNRFEYGYGLTPPIVELVCAKGAQVLITVDNGMSSIEGVAAAKAAGLCVIVTDHHLPGATLPAADAIVNPNAQGDAFPSKARAGVGVIFYVMLALRARLRQDGWFAARGIPDPNLGELLDLVALGTVADVVPLDANNRCLVAHGLARLRAGRCVPGLTALIRIAGKDPRRLVAADLGFALGPRLNAAGRLADMATGIALLTSDDPRTCERIARELDGMNRARRDIEQDMKTQAMAIVANLLDTPGTAVPAGICLYDEHWHQGVIGVVAARIKEHYHRPVIVFARGEDGELKGSARSIPGVHIRDVLDALATHNPGLLGRFGGHAMAAGLALQASDLARFTAAFAAEVTRVVDPILLERVLLTDGELAPGDFSLALARQLSELVPWGQGFPEPIFEGLFGVRERRVVGEQHLKLKLELPDGALIDAIAFNAVEAPWAASAASIYAAYRLSVNEWNGKESLQLMIEHATAGV